MTLWDLPPWGQLPYFTPLIETSIGAGAGVTVTKPNNQRIGIMFSSPTAGTNLTISTDPAMVAKGLSMAINPNNSPFWLNCRDHSILPTLGWFASSTANFTIWELIVQDWPRDGDDPLKNIMHPPYVPPQPPVITAPGVKGDLGIMSYWRSVVDRIRGK